MHDVLAEHGCQPDEYEFPELAVPFEATCPVCRNARALTCNVDSSGEPELRCDARECEEERIWGVLELRDRLDAALRLREERCALGLTADTGVRFQTPRQLRLQVPAEPDWVIDGYLACGALTLFGGAPKVGKSTLLLGGLVSAVACRSESFLGQRVRGGPVVLVTEEGTQTALDKLPDSDDIHVLTRDSAWPKPSWPDLIAAAVEHGRSVGARLFLVDSVPAWAGLGPDGEKDAGVAQATMEALTTATSAGLAVGAVQQQRKAGGEHGVAFRGSSAIAASADALVEIERLPDGATPTQRRIAAIARWGTTTPRLLVCDYDVVSRSWRVVGYGDDRNDAAAISWRERILNVVSDTPPGATYSELEELLSTGKKEFLAAISGLVLDGTLSSAGRGVKGDPKRFWQTKDSVPGFHSGPGTDSPAAAVADDSVSHSTPRRGNGNRIEPPPSGFRSVPSIQNGMETQQPTNALERQRGTLR